MQQKRQLDLGQKWIKRYKNVLYMVAVQTLTDLLSSFLTVFSKSCTCLLIAKTDAPRLLKIPLTERDLKINPIKVLFIFCVYFSLMLNTTKSLSLCGQLSAFHIQSLKSLQGRLNCKPTESISLGYPWLICGTTFSSKCMTCP